MPIEYCPRCRVVRNANTTETRERRIADDGRCYEVAVRTVHCSACQTFLRREEVPLAHESKNEISA